MKIFNMLRCLRWGYLKKLTTGYISTIPTRFILSTLFILLLSCKGKMDDKDTDMNEQAPTIFREDFNTAQIDEEVWQIGTWKEHEGELGRERCFVEDGYLNMQLINEDNAIKSSAIQTRSTFLYGKWEARLKISDVPGVLNSFYTIDWGDGDGTKQEVDIEFLTFSFGENSGEVHFAVHAAGLESFDTNPDIKLDFNPSDDFHVWGLDINPEYIEWSVDGEPLLTYRYEEHEVKIDSPYMLKLNTRTQEKWINGPSEEGVMSTYLIDWIQFTPHE